MAVSAEPPPADGRPQHLTPGALFGRLKDATAAIHDDVEAMVPLLDPALTVTQYRDFLAALWGVHGALEPQLAAMAGLTDVVPDLARRWKSALLATDLAALGVDAAGLPVLDRPMLDSVDDALGCLYVLEGSTLGGQILRRHLAAVLPEVARSAGRFLGGYGADTGARWTAFRGHVLNAAGRDDDAIVTAACATFAAIRDWLGRERPAPAGGRDGPA